MRSRPKAAGVDAFDPERFLHVSTRARHIPPYRNSRERATSHRDPESGRVAAGQIVQSPGKPGASAAAEDRRQHHCAENAAIMTTAKTLCGYRSHHGSKAVTERSLG